MYIHIDILYTMYVHKYAMYKINIYVYIFIWHKKYRTEMVLIHINSVPHLIERFCWFSCHQVIFRQGFTSPFHTLWGLSSGMGSIERPQRFFDLKTEQNWTISSYCHLPWSHSVNFVSSSFHLTCAPSGSREEMVRPQLQSVLFPPLLRLLGDVSSYHHWFLNLYLERRSIIRVPGSTWKPWPTNRLSTIPSVLVETQDNVFKCCSHLNFHGVSHHSPMVNASPVFDAGCPKQLEARHPVVVVQVDRWGWAN